MISVNKKGSLKLDELFILESQVEQVFYIQDPKNVDWKYLIKTQPRDLYDMLSKDKNEEVLDVDAYQQSEVDAGCHTLRQGECDSHLIHSLAIDAFIVEREASVIKLVTKATEEKKQKGEIEVFEDSSEEEL